MQSAFSEFSEYFQHTLHLFRSDSHNVMAIFTVDQTLVKCHLLKVEIVFPMLICIRDKRREIVSHFIYLVDSYTFILQHCGSPHFQFLSSLFIRSLTGEK